MLKKDIHLESLYTELPFENRFAAAKADGFTAVELWSWTIKTYLRFGACWTKTVWSWLQCRAMALCQCVIR
jgi:hypothetical protein